MILASRKLQIINRIWKNQENNCIDRVIQRDTENNNPENLCASQMASHGKNRDAERFF